MIPSIKINIDYITKLLSYDELLFNNIIPDLKLSSILLKQPTKKIPTFARTNMDSFTRHIKTIIFGKSITEPLSDKETRYINVLKKEIPEISNKGGVFEVLTTFGHIEDTIDIVGDDYLIDIVIIQNPTKNNDEMLLRLLIEKIMTDVIRKNLSQNSIRYVGILLVLQSTLIWFDLQNWNTEKFIDIVQMHSQECCGDKQVELCGSINKGPLFHDSNIGTHVTKEFVLDLNQSYKFPIQFFLSNPQGRLTINDTEIAKLTQNISKYNVRVFIHSPYIINLCSDIDSYGIKRLEQELHIGKIIGVKGVVVHVGKYTTFTYAKGIEIMIETLLTVLKNATIECPLILETPAGQGTELCSSLESFIWLFKHPRLASAITNKLLTVCIDSCHVFSLGYDPTYFLTTFINEQIAFISLIHFNDSQNCRGSRIDRHEHPGLGYIGYARMKIFFEYAMKNNIPCIIE